MEPKMTQFNIRNTLSNLSFYLTIICSICFNASPAFSQTDGFFAEKSSDISLPTGTIILQPETHFIRHPKIPSGYLQFGFGYTHSSWNSFSNELKNGSSTFRVAMFQKFNSWDLGISFGMISGMTPATNNENLNAVHFGADLLYVFKTFKQIETFLGAGLQFGSYRAWSVSTETPSEITFQKHGSGHLVGITPQAGLRFNASPFFSIDLVTQYTEFFQKPAKNIGGPSLLLALNFSR